MRTYGLHPLRSAVRHALRGAWPRLPLCAVAGLAATAATAVIGALLPPHGRPVATDVDGASSLDHCAVRSSFISNYLSSRTVSVCRSLLFPQWETTAHLCPELDRLREQWQSESLSTEFPFSVAAKTTFGPGMRERDFRARCVGVAIAYLAAATPSNPPRSQSAQFVHVAALGCAGSTWYAFEVRDAIGFPFDALVCTTRLAPLSFNPPYFAELRNGKPIDPPIAGLWKSMASAPEFALRAYVPSQWIPNWPGLVANLVSWSVFLWCVMAGCLAAQAWRRIRLGLCPSCGHDAGRTSASSCPECGEALRP